MKYFYEYESDIGVLSIVEEDNQIIKLVINKQITDIQKQETPLINKTYNQIQEYLNGKRLKFEIPILLKGTEFQKKVWEKLISVPYGEVTSYKYVATQIGLPNASRAVGNACNKNPLLIIVPCHRILGSDKTLKGFAAGISVKEKLLNLEARVCTKN